MRIVTRPANRRGPRPAIGLLASAALVVAISAAGTTGAYAFNDRLETLFTHFFDCKALLLTNPAQHTKQCGPSRVVTPFESIASKGGDAAPIVVVNSVVEPPKEEPCKEWDYYCWCHEEGGESWSPGN
jgi:hypothetical protein